MKILIDTHILLWSLGDTKKLSNVRLRELQTQTNQVFVSSITIAELMIKSSIGKLRVNYDPIEVVEKSGFELLDFTAHDAVLLKDLPMLHKDPFDRMLICQSKANKLHLMSDDEQFNLYDCKLL